MMRQRLLLFKPEMTKDMMTFHAGLSLFGEFAVGLGTLDIKDKYLSKPGSGDGHKKSEYIYPILLTLNGGGRSLEDICEIRHDEGMQELLPY